MNDPQFTDLTHAILLALVTLGVLCVAVMYAAHKTR